MDIWLVIDIAVLALLDVLALRSLWRLRATLDRWRVVRWAAFIVLVPLIGVLAYGTWRFETAVEQRRRADAGHEAAPFLRTFDRDR